jgi:ribosomal protein L1
MQMDQSKGGSVDQMLKNRLEIFNSEYDSLSIFKKAKEISKERKCKESFEVIIKLNVDPTKGD